MMDDEQAREREELEREIKSIDSSLPHKHNPIKDQQIKGGSHMSNITQQKNRVATKTSGSNKGVVLDLASLKERIAKRKAQRA
ncbi:hypothetical protein [Proteus vulgaris]|nr:hypothetical protein [Proteus vulgaris]CRL62456.1 hypothetical protein BN1805_01803 [Proteus vulgaris]